MTNVDKAKLAKEIGDVLAPLDEIAAKLREPGTSALDWVALDVMRARTLLFQTQERLNRSDISDFIST